MENADVFVIPSYSEGFSLAMLEAGTIGSSIVCSDIPAFNLPFSRNEVSFFKLNNIKSLEIAVDEALKLKEEKTKLLQKKIKTCFSEDVMFLQYENLYKKLK